MNFCACSSRMVSTSSGTAAAAASSSFGGYWNRLQIFVVMVWKPAGSARIAGEPNSVIACRNAISAPATKRRQRQRNRDAPRRGPGPAAEDGGSVLQFARHVVERVRHQHEHERKGVAGDDENDPGHRIDVEQMLAGLDAGHEAIELVEQSAVGRRQQFPGDGAEKRRRHERGRDQRAYERPSRHVGARHQPPHRRRYDAADHGRGGGDGRGGHQRIEKIRIGEQRDEIPQRQAAGLFGERCRSRATTAASRSAPPGTPQTATAPAGSSRFWRAGFRRWRS